MFPFTPERTRWAPHASSDSYFPSPHSLSFRGEKLCKVWDDMLWKMTVAGLKQFVTSTVHGRKEPAHSKQGCSLQQPARSPFWGISLRRWTGKQKGGEFIGSGNLAALPKHFS